MNSYRSRLIYRNLWFTVLYVTLATLPTHSLLYLVWLAILYLGWHADIIVALPYLPCLSEPVLVCMFLFVCL